MSSLPQKIFENYLLQTHIVLHWVLQSLW